jgi:hypothetical protein
MSLSPIALASIWSFASFLIAFGAVWYVNRRSSLIYFNPQDFAKAHPEKALPEFSKAATFDPFITQYTGMSKVMIGLAAASISFGGVSTNNSNVFTAKMLLAYSIAFSLIFCITAINFYEGYLHDLGYYTPFRIALVESSGIASMFCFALGYGFWAWHI